MANLRTQLRLHQISGSLNEGASASAALASGQDILDQMSRALKDVRGTAFTSAGVSILSDAAAVNRISYINSAGTLIKSEDGTATALTIGSSTGDDVTVAAAGDLTVAGNTTIAGNLDVNGTVTTIDTVNLQVEDRLIELGRGTIQNATDAGLVLSRGAAAAASATLTIGGAIDDDVAITIQSQSNADVVVTEGVEFSKDSDTATTAQRIADAINLKTSLFSANVVGSIVTVFALSDSSADQVNNNKTIALSSGTNMTLAAFAAESPAQSANRLGNVASFYDESSDVFKFMYTDNDASDLLLSVKEAQILPVEVDMLHISQSSMNLKVNPASGGLGLFSDASVDVVFSGDGLFIQDSGTSSGNVGKIKLFNQANSFHAGFDVLDGLSADYLLTLPSALPPSDQALFSDASGDLSFKAVPTLEDMKKRSMRIEATHNAQAALNPNAAPVASDDRAALDLGSDDPIALKSIDVYVNGQLLMTGSIAEVEDANPTKDYRISTFGTASQLKFGFALEADDIVTVIKRA